MMLEEKYPGLSQILRLMPLTISYYLLLVNDGLFSISIY